jgi:uncharacterized protein YecE (DUF72 family)
MKFGKVEHPSITDPALPADHSQTTALLRQYEVVDQRFSIGFPTWAKDKLVGFYPKGVKNELAHYSQQLNAIELNASYYRIFKPEQWVSWRDQTPDEFRFYPKLVQNISHWRKLNDCEALVDEFIYAVSKLEHKLGTCFLQMHESYTPNSMEGFSKFISNWPKGFPLAVELRNERWHTDPNVVNELNDILMKYGIDNIITDSLGRRDMVHMRLTTDRTFIRFAAADHPSDLIRLNAWADRLLEWWTNGIGEVAFFIHQNTEKENPMLASYFVERINTTLGTELHVPQPT